jgi:hypothetical protein
MTTQNQNTATDSKIRGFVSLDGIEPPQQRPSAVQIIERPPLQEQPELIHAADPAGKS